MITHGSPCTSFSLAGKQKGGDENSGTKSSLMWYTVKIIKEIRPKYILWENVTNVLSDKHKHNYDKYLKVLKDNGYENYAKVINAKYWGVPQNRNRIFVVSVRKDVDQGFKFPISSLEGQQTLFNNNVIEIEKTILKDVLEDEVNSKYYLSKEAIQYMNREVDDGRNHWDFGHHSNSDEVAKTVTANIWKGVPYGVVKIKNKIVCEQRTDEGLRFFKDNVCGTLRTIDSCGDKRVLELIQVGELYGGKWENINENCKRIYSSEGLSPTVHTCQGGNTEPKIYHLYKLRKLIPLECWRLMGFDDEDYWRARKVLEEKYYNGADRSDSQLYRQSGNSICVPVLKYIFKSLFQV